MKKLAIGLTMVYIAFMGSGTNALAWVGTQVCDIDMTWHCQCPAHFCPPDCTGKYTDPGYTCDQFGLVCYNGGTLVCANGSINCFGQLPAFRCTFDPETGRCYGASPDYYFCSDCGTKPWCDYPH
jgi:hypothetical protein